MKFTIDTSKIAEAVTDFGQKTSEKGRKAIADVQSGAVALSEKAKQDSYLRRMKKYNPVFPDAYNSAEFIIPSIIVIRSDMERRDIDVCQGSIGWLDEENGMDVFHLYDKDVASAGLQFVPAPSCDSVYYADSFNPKRYIRTDCVFSKSHEERLAELKYVAHCLGAKRCSIEISESTAEIEMSKKKGIVVGGSKFRGITASSSESAEQNVSAKKASQRSGMVTAEFEGSDNPKKPKLKWFANDDNIKRLIDMRCKGNNLLKSETLRLSGTSSATMSQKAACAIDTTIGVMKIKGNTTMESQLVKETSCTLIYSVEF